MQPNNTDSTHQWGTWSSAGTGNPTAGIGRRAGGPARAPWAPTDMAVPKSVSDISERNFLH